VTEFFAERAPAKPAADAPRSSRPLDPVVRATMEQRFGFDFRNVRIHDDPERVRDLDAVAYTTGQDIGFAPGRYQPHTPWGQALIAHELAHVTQQAGHQGSPQAPVSAPDEAAEQAADTAATVFRSVRTGGDTKTRRSRRSLAIPNRAVRALRRQHTRQAVQRDRAGDDWQDNDLVFASQVGTEMDRHNVLRGFRRILKAAGQPGRVDATGATAQLRVAALRRQGAHRGHLAPGRTQRHGRHRTGLPTPDPTSSRGGCHRNGPDLPGQRPSSVVTQLVTHTPW
jgi:uncharacterized protein DUF4157